MNAAAAEQGSNTLRLIRRRNVLVIGKSQVGKSHLCNVLCGRQRLFKEGSYIASCTSAPCEETFVCHWPEQNIDYHITLTDTPGMFDSRTTEQNETLMARITTFVRNHQDSINRVFYVFKRGVVSQEEVDCLVLMRSLLSDRAIDEGICSMVVTHCDGTTMTERAEMVQAMKNGDGFRSFLPMFAKEKGGEPEILPVDFSAASKTLYEDRASLMASIMAAEVPMHKTLMYRLYATLKQEEELKKIREALLTNLIAKYKAINPNTNTSNCPQQ